MSADFDKAIDGAVRELLDVAPPAGLRRRVIEQLAAPRSPLPASGFRLPAFAKAPAGKRARWRVASSFSWKVLLPVAAAAVLVIAVLLTRGTPQQPETTTAQVQQPVSAPVTTPVPPSAPESPLPQPVPQVISERRVVATATPAEVTVDAPPAPGFPRLPALSVPELSVSSIQRVAPVEGPNAIAPDPIATPSPLAIEPLPADGRQSQE